MVKRKAVPIYGSLKSKQQNKRKLFSTHHIIHQPWTMNDILIFSHKIVFIGSEQHLCTSFSSIAPEELGFVVKQILRWKK